MAHLIRTSFHQNPNVGLYSYANEKICLLPLTVSREQEKEIGEILKVPTYRMNLCGTSMLGVFIAGNNNSILIPSISFDAEIKKLESWKIHHHILMTDHTALGNNLVANDHACLISPDIEPFKAEIKKMLQVEKIEVFTIGGIPTIGALMSLNDKGCLLSAFATEEEAAYVSQFFKVPVTRGTVNLGSPHVRSGVTANNHGFIFGDRTGGPEAIQIDEALGFLK